MSLQRNQSIEELTRDFRRRVDSIKRADIRNLCRAAYLLGAARIGELCGNLSESDTQNPKNREHHYKRRQIIYGPRGTDASETTYSIENFSMQQTLTILASKRPDESLEDAFERFRKVRVALFRIKIEKKHIERDEDVKSRVVALPLEDKYDPWVKEVYNWFKMQGEGYAFPLTRQLYWHHITHTDPVFDGLYNPVEDYSFYFHDGQIKIKKTVSAHLNPFKFHGIRKLRVNFLYTRCNFSGLDFASHIGWSLRAARSADTQDRIPAMLGRYASIYENWERYFPKLLVKHL